MFFVRKKNLSLFTVMVLYYSALFASPLPDSARHDTIRQKNFLYTGISTKGLFQGLWIATDTATHVIKYYLHFENGILLSKHYIDPKCGPLLLSFRSQNLDTLREYVYKEGGEILSVRIITISDTSLWEKNSFSAEGESGGESALKIIKAYEYYYDSDNVPGLLYLKELNYGGRNYSHYYYKGEFICTFDDNGKLSKGSKKRYSEIMKNHK
jgi:hypothetical protein